MREDAQSVREAGQAYTKLMAQPPADAKEEEEVEQPEADLAESDEETEQVEETEEAEEESEEGEESEDQEEGFLDIVWKGDTLNVTKTEAKDLAQKGYDYSQKMSKMSDDVKVQAEKQAKAIVDEKTADLDKKRQGLIETTELLEQFIGKPAVSDEELKKMLDDGDTEGYLRVKQQEDQRKTLVSNLKAERVKVQKEQQAEKQKQWDAYAAKQKEILLTNVPELKNEDYGKNLIKYAKSKGYSDEDLKYAVDARALEVLDKARKWDEMTKKGIKPKPKSKSPKVTKKASSTTPRSAKQNQSVKSRRDTFSKSQSTRDAGKLLASMYANKQR